MLAASVAPPRRQPHPLTSSPLTWRGEAARGKRQGGGPGTPLSTEWRGEGGEVSILDLLFSTAALGGTVDRFEDGDGLAALFRGAHDRRAAGERRHHVLDHVHGPVRGQLGLPLRARLAAL